MNLGKLVEKLKQYIINNYIKDYDSFINFMNNYDVNVENLDEQIKEYFDESQLTADDLKTLKKDLQDAGKRYDNKNFNINFQKNFGKESKFESSIQKEHKEIAKDYVIKQAIKFATMEKVFSGKPRNVYNFLCGTTNDLEEFKRIVDIYKVEDDTQIDPKYNKSYKELKEQIFIKQLNKAEAVLEYFSKPRAIEEMKNQFKENRSFFEFLSEVDGDKLNQIMDALNIHSEEVDKKLENIKKYKNIAIAINPIKNLFDLHSNPLTKYASIEDLAALSGMYNTNMEVDGSPIDFAEEINEDLKEKMEEIELDQTKVSQLSSFDEMAKILDFEKHSLVTNGKLNSKMKCEVMYSLFDCLAQKNLSNVNDLKFYNSKNEKIEFTENEDKQKTMERIYEECIKGEKFIIKDKNGKFIDSFLTDQLSFGLNKQNNDIVTFEIETICENFENDLSSFESLKEASEELNNQLDEEYNRNLVTLKEQIDKASKIKLKNDKEEFTTLSGAPGEVSIGEMFEELINAKMSDNKEEFLSGIKSVRTFCQAYLDENIDKTSKEMKQKCEILQNVYKSLSSIEGDMDRILSVEENLPLEMQLKGKALDAKDIEKYNKAIEPNKIERKQMFTEDPTKNNEEINKSERKESKSLTKDLENEVKLNDKQ